MTLQIILYLLAAILIIAGLAGTVVPALPGVPMIFGGMLLVAWLGDFQTIGTVTLVVLGMLTVLAVIADFVAGVLGAKRVGASHWALWGAAIGTVVGMFFGPAGLMLGPFLGALVGELVAGSTLRHAGSVGAGAWVGFVLGTLVKIALSFTMLGIFALAFLLRLFN